MGLVGSKSLATKIAGPVGVALVAVGWSVGLIRGAAGELLCVVDGRGELLGDAPFRFSLVPYSAVYLHMAKRFAVRAHMEFVAGYAPDADVLTSLRPMNRASLRGQLALAGHEETEFPVISKACL